ncbi:MAG: phosphoenolpyruvate--protein phosphotransferase, partial [Anaerolineae bacterium]|nr:phosphoenolpyruvate--protein phosphotransferase [Anaerolineae bacterium]
DNLEEVAAVAQGGLLAKQTELEDVEPDTDPNEPAIDTSAGQEIRLTIRNAHGLHARPAAKFVSTAGQFEADISVENVTRGRGPVSAKSINRVATLGARKGHEIVVIAQGPDADAALQALQALVDDNFGEAEVAETEPTAASKPDVPQLSDGHITAIGASIGLAVGPAVLYTLAPIAVTEESVDDPTLEIERLEAALKMAKREIQALYTQTKSQLGREKADIFDAHRQFLEDPSLVDATKERITEQSINAEAAWHSVITEMANSYLELEDEVFQARATDVKDVGQRVLKVLTGQQPKSLELTEPGILVASDLTPSDTAQLDPGNVLGICTELGTNTSHTAIIAKAMGIPAVVGLGPDFSTLAEGKTIALNGESGDVWLDPPDDKVAEIKSQRETWLAERSAAREAAQAPAITQDGQQIEIVANIGGLNDAKSALENGAEGVGLLRTEFLYLDRSEAPTEDEQFEIYQAIANIMEERPLIVRTLDIGGDKPLPYMNLESEANPFLGWRGIRICLDWPDMFKDQLRAILRASVGHQIKIMFPMVSTLSELQAAKQILAEVQDDLRQAEIAFDEAMEIGIMIEVPAAVAIADQLAAEIDFFSIGTNDLSQYTMASDRTNAKVAALADTFQPAILRLIRQTIEAAHAAGKWVGLCGEFAANPLAVPILLGFELDEFSMSSPAIPNVKQAIKQLTTEQAKSIATAVVDLESAQDVRLYVEQALADA